MAIITEKTQHNPEAGKEECRALRSEDEVKVGEERADNESIAQKGERILVP